MKKKEIILFSILCIWILLPSILGVIMADDLLNIGQRILYIIAAILLNGAGLCFLKRRTFFYVASTAFLLSGVELIHIIMNHATTSLLFLFSCIKSEKGEFLELCSTYWFVLLIFMIIWGVYFWLTRKYIENEYIMPHRWRMRILCVILAFFAMSIVGLKLGNKFRNTFNLHAQDMRTMAWVGVEKVCPINMILSGYHLVDMQLDILKMENNLEHFSFNIPKTLTQDSTIVVLVFGETSRYDHWQINGYPRETSPKLMQRKEDIISFDSCFSVANLTTVSVPMMLSRATPENVRLYLEEKSVVDAFHEAGYRTSWISDQSFNNEFLLRIAHACDYCQYVMDDGDMPNFVDSVLLAPLRETLVDPSPKQMIVLHSLGCHYKYSSRYPDEASYFKPDLKDGLVSNLLEGVTVVETPEEMVLKYDNSQSGSRLKTSLVNSYDNAVRYSDEFLDQVIGTLEATGRPVVLLYVSDHGENLLDDERQMFMHGTYSGSVYEYHVPFMVWTSSSYRELHPAKVAAMRNNVHKVFSTMTVFHSLLDLGDVAYSQLDTSDCVTFPNMSSRKRIYGLDANMHTFEVPLQ